jgi:hypothetical protein
MILLFKSGSVFSRSTNDEEAGSIFPLISIPTNVEGESTELNDFQWWSYTDEWQQWLKKNPREWQAESQHYLNNIQTWVDELLETEDFYRQFFDFQARSLLKKGKISSFDDFLKIYEAEEESTDAGKKFTKFIYAIQSLVKSGVLKPKMEMDSLDTKTSYAVVVDLLEDKTKKPNPMARQALRMKLVAKTKSLIVADVDYSLPQEIEIGSDMEGYWKNVSEFVKDVATAGVAITGVILAGQIGIGIFSGWALRYTLRKSIKSFVIPGIRSSAPAIFNTIRGWFGASAAAQAAAGGAGVPSAAVASGQAAASGGAAAGGSALATGGLVVAAVVALGSIQRSFNWFSSKQAPIYTKVKDFAKGNFKPEEIEIGKPITICWTQESGSGLFASMAWGSDSRTTMDLIKILETKEKSYFLMVNVNSKSLGKILKDNELVMLVFNNDENFERGYIDNEDLEFESVAIKSMDDLVVPTSFYGYCDWSEMQEAFDEAPDRAWYVPSEAPDNYEFNYQNKKSEKINVSGKLMSESDLESSGVVKFLPDLSKFMKESDVKENYEHYPYNKLQELRLSDFSEFSFLNEENKEEETKQDKKEVPDVDDLEKQWEKDYKNDSRTQSSAEEFQKSHEESKYKRCMMTIYRVNSIEWVNPNEKSEVPTIKYFVVAPQSLDPEIGDPVAVEPTSEDIFYNSRFGLATYEKPKEVEEPEEEEGIAPLQPGPEDGEDEKVKASPKDVSIVDRKRRLIIKDDPSGEAGEDVNVAEEFLTRDQRKELGIENWKTVTKVTLVYDRDKKPTKVILKNKEAGILGDRVRRIKKGQAGFDAAVKFAEEIKDRISYK